ncbi:MAG: aquaporin family protein [Candidatus Poseidoniaceae archaeon]|nr:aquaporin family protein [Candidatus Poseidoniaceae archaeon]
MLRRLLAEFIGTWFMVGVGCGSIAIGAPGWVISSAFGAAVTLAILVFQPISGAHINPAVSIAFARSGHLEKQALVPYIAAQLAGAFTAAWMLKGIGPTELAPDVSHAMGAVIEVFITFALMASIYWIVVKSETHVSIAFFVGGTVALLAYLFGPLTGASMNPARTFGPNMVQGLYSSLPFYWVTTIIGALVAAELFLRLQASTEPQD